MKNIQHKQLTFAEPTLVFASAKNEMERVPGELLFNNAEYKPLRERWAAGMFGRGYSKFVRPCDLAVIETKQRQDVDMYVRTADETFEFQIAEVQPPGRSRGREYREMAIGKFRTAPYEPQRHMQEGPRWLAGGAEKKLRKRYANSKALHVLLYANFETSALKYEDVHLALTPFSGLFASLWVITALDLCSVFSVSNLGEISRWARIRTIEEAHNDD